MKKNVNDMMLEYKVSELIKYRIHSEKKLQLMYEDIKDFLKKNPELKVEYDDMYIDRCFVKAVVDIRENYNFSKRAEDIQDGDIKVRETDFKYLLKL